eukprot:tig00000711_g3379.t1
MRRSAFAVPVVLRLPRVQRRPATRADVAACSRTGGNSFVPFAAQRPRTQLQFLCGRPASSSKHWLGPASAPRRQAITVTRAAMDEDLDVGAAAGPPPDEEAVKKFTHNYRMVVAYDGTEFAGFQTQPSLRTVQEELDKALKKMLGSSLWLVGAGRTDSGVHANGSVVNFLYHRPLNTDRFRLAINNTLPPDIKVIAAERVPMNFHAQYSAMRKVYRYQIFLGPVLRPADRFYAWQHPHWRSFDAGLFEAACAQYVGTHDFISFTNVHRDNRALLKSGGAIPDRTAEGKAPLVPGTEKWAKAGTVRTVFRCEVVREERGVAEQVGEWWSGAAEPPGTLLRVDVEGNGFMYRQVRNMVGLAAEVARGRRPPDEPARLLRSSLSKADCRDTLGGPSAPAHGLTLHSIQYPPLPAGWAEEVAREASTAVRPNSIFLDS